MVVMQINRSKCYLVITLFEITNTHCIYESNNRTQFIESFVNCVIGDLACTNTHISEILPQQQQKDTF